MATRLFAPGSEDVLYIVDLSGYVFRAYHAVAPLTSPAGEPTHAVYGTVNMLERLIRQRRPALLAVAMDSRCETFRKEIYEEYKANRPPAPPDLKQQLTRVREIIDACAIPVLQQDGVEADDLIATAVAQAIERQLRVVIVSADKDMMQLVREDVLMWDTMRDRVVGPPEVEQRFGVSAGQMRDLLALMGDSSDNVPGVPSVGPKTARDLLRQHQTLESVYAHLDQIKRAKLRDALREHHQQALLSQRLVTLKSDCPVDLDPDALRFGGRDTARLRRVYQELGFHRLLKALDDESDDGHAAGSAGPGDGASALPWNRYQTVLTRDALQRVAEQVRAAERCALRVLTCSADRRQPRIAGIALAFGSGDAVYVPVAHRCMGAPPQLSLEAVREILAPLLSDASVRKGGHDLKSAYITLGHAELPLRGAVFDAMLASYLLNPEAPNALPELAERELGTIPTRIEEVTRDGKKRRDFDELPLDAATRFAAAEADLVGRLWNQLVARLDEERLTELFDQVEIPLSRLLAEMETTGVLLDSAHLSRLGVGVRAELERLEQQAQQIAGRAFNVNSPRQLETLLFDELGLKPIKRTKTSRSTDAATLEALAEQHALPRVILDFRRLAKLRGTYIDALPGLADPVSQRLHTSWQQAVTATGRLSSADPNLQNIPIRTDLGRSIRGAFVAPPGYQLVSADYSQIELRVLAHLAQDPVLLDAFRSNQDVHARTAVEIFNVPESGVTAEMRRRAKAVNFGVIYGQGDSGLAKSLGIPRAEASNFIAAYYRRYEGVRRFMLDETLVQARASESVRTLLGRRRMLPDIRSGNRAKRLAAERIAMNLPIQGTAADLLKLAMLKLAEPVTPGARMIMTVHDELVFEVPEAEVPVAQTKIRAAMESVCDWSVPLVVDIGHGPTWNDAH